MKNAIFFLAGAWVCALLFAGCSSSNTVATTNVAPGTTNGTPGISALLSPQGITGDFKGKVALTVGNLSAAGKDLFIEQYVDANRNGKINAGDFVIRSLRITDGSVSTNPNVQGDEDGAADSAIVTTFNYYLLNDLYHAPGYYIFRVTSGSDTTAVPFIVSAESRPQSISGTVTGNATPLPGAIVQLADKWQRPISSSMADENGRYTLYLKDAGEYQVTPASYGYAASTVQTPVTVAAGQTITGYNLTLLPGVFQVTGRLKDTNTGAGIDGVWVKANGTAVSGIAITGADGGFSLTLPAGMFSIATAAEPTHPNPSTKGYLGFNKQAVTTDVATDVNIPDIGLPRAGILVTGRTLTGQGVPVPGVPVQGRTPAENAVQEPVTFGVTDASGGYALAVIPGDNWNISLKDSSAQRLGYIGNGIGNFSTTSSSLTGNDLTVYPITAWIQGTVKDANGNQIAGSDIQLKKSDSSVVSAGLSAKTTGTISATSTADPLASTKTQAVYNYLSNLSNGSSKRILSGQYAESMSDITGIFNTTGKNVALLGMDYAWNPLSDADVIAWSDAGGFVTVGQHFRNPATGGDMFDTTSVNMIQLITEGTELNTTFKGYLDTLATHLSAFQNANAVVILRLFHEMNGSWFWWGGKDPTQYKKVWKYTFNYLTNTKGLHNLIWNWSPYQVSTTGTLDTTYYPGAAYVDIAGVSIYGRGNTIPVITGIPDNKPFAVNEWGYHTGGMTFQYSSYPPADIAPMISSLEANMPNAIYWMAWNGIYSMNYNTNTSTLLADPWVITRDEIPAFGAITPVATSVATSVATAVATAADGTYRFGAFAGNWLVDNVTHNKGNQTLEQAVTLVDSQTATVDFVVDDTK